MSWSSAPGSWLASLVALGLVDQLGEGGRALARAPEAGEELVGELERVGGSSRRLRVERREQGLCRVRVELGAGADDLARGPALDLVE